METVLINNLEKNYGFQLGDHMFSDIEALARFLSKPIQKMLASQNAYLFQILYQRDISETKIRRILLQDPEDLAAFKIALLIIQRESEKIKTQTEYSSQTDYDEDCQSW